MNQLDEINGRSFWYGLGNFLQTCFFFLHSIYFEDQEEFSFIVAYFKDPKICYLFEFCLFSYYLVQEFLADFLICCEEYTLCEVRIACMNTFKMFLSKFEPVGQVLIIRKLFNMIRNKEIQ